MKNWFLVGLLMLTLAAHAADPQWEGCKKQVFSTLPTLEGWCSAEKAEKMMDLIYKTKPQVCVEVGVFGGSSIYPTASALQHLGQGKVYAIDPWTKADGFTGYAPDDPNYLWWKSVDLESIYRGFLAMLQRYQLVPFCSVLRMTSEQAALRFPDASIDIIHIDGNHTEESSFGDVTRWVPKLASGGYLWMDDVNWSITRKDGVHWPTTRKAVEYLRKHCIFDAERSTENCYLFRKP